MLRISQRTVERYVKDQIKKPRPDLAAHLETEVKRRWQPQIRTKAREKAASTGGIVVDTRARLGYVAPVGSTDEDRGPAPDRRPAAASRRPPLRGSGTGRRRRPPEGDRRRSPQGDLLPGRRPPRRLPGGGPLHGHRAPGVRPVEAVLVERPEAEAVSRSTMVVTKAGVLSPGPPNGRTGLTLVLPLRDHVTGLRQRCPGTKTTGSSRLTAAS